MTRPLILLFYEKLLPGSQLQHRLEDLGYAVKTVADVALLLEQAEGEKPLLVIADLEPRHDLACQAVGRLKQNPATAHIPVIGIALPQHSAVHEAARQAGANLVVNEQAILRHLEQFLQQALAVD